MKKTIVLSLCLLVASTALAQSVSYTHKAFSPEGCTVRYTAMLHEDAPAIVVNVSSDRLVFDENPIMMIKLSDDEVIKLEGTLLRTDSKKSGIVFGVGDIGFIAPVTSLQTMALFPISAEQIEKLPKGVAKVRLSTIPIMHERYFKKDKIGNNLYLNFKELYETKTDF